MEEKEEEKYPHENIVNEALNPEWRKGEPPTLMQYLRSLRNHQFLKDERDRIFGQGPIIRDPRTNEPYTNPLTLLGDTMDTVNDQVTLKNISPMLRFLPEDNTPRKLKDVMNYSLKDFQYDAMDSVGEKARENINTGIPNLDKVLVGGAVLGTALMVPDATDIFIPGASDALKASRKVDWNKLIDNVFNTNPFARYQAAGDVPLNLDNSIFYHKSDDIIPSGDARSIDPTKGGITPKGAGDQTGRRTREKYLQEGDLWASLPTQTQNKLNDLGFTHEDNIFVIDKYRSISREEAAVIENLWSTTSDFEKVKEAALPFFFDSMKGVNITKKPNLDHIAQLKASLGFFNGQPIKKWPMISDIIVKEGVYGLGHDAKNLEFLEFDVHVAKTNFWNDMVGPAGEKFFKNPDGSWKVFTNDNDLKAAAREFAKLIRKSDEIVGIANDQFKMMNSNAEMPLSVFEAIMQRVTTNPYKYNTKQVKAILNEIAKDKTTLAGFDYNMRKHLLPKGFKKELDKLSNFIRSTENGLAIVLDLSDGRLVKEFGEELQQLELEEISKIVRNKTINSQIKATYGAPIRRHGKYGRAKPIDPAKGQVGSGIDPFDDLPDDFIDPEWENMIKK